MNIRTQWQQAERLATLALRHGGTSWRLADRKSLSEPLTGHLISKLQLGIKISHIHAENDANSKTHPMPHRSDPCDKRGGRTTPPTAASCRHLVLLPRPAISDRSTLFKPRLHSTYLPKFLQDHRKSQTISLFIKTQEWCTGGTFRTGY